MKRSIIYIIGLVFILITACRNDDFDVEIPDFNFPQTITFEQNLSSYNIFEGDPADLTPSKDFHLFELSSILFTDYAHKQRLVKVPDGTQITKLNDGTLDYPDGTILTKTFYYYKDERNKNLGKRIIETRLLIKENNIWNIATYIWNQNQTDATLILNGFDTEVSWTNSNGNTLSTVYHVPNENECIACHQSKSTMTPLGPNLRNLNRTIERNNTRLNQINHLQSAEILTHFPINQVSQIVDYNNLTVPLDQRGRAYLAMNCAHCHNPDGWDQSARRDFDFRYETPIDQTGIVRGKNRIVNVVSQKEMPFIGTTILDKEGVDLIIKYIESL